MAEHSYTSRRELDQYGFHPAVTLLLPLACLLVQVMLPKSIPPFIHLDLPLIATIFFAVARRSPVAGTLTGTLIGLFQDGLTNQPFGVNGITKGVIGYVAASIGFAVDVDNLLNRVMLIFGFSLVQSGMLFVISRWLLGDLTMRLMPVHDLLAATGNTVVGVPFFYLLDRFKTRD
jgi:rod shape-determining protein MreD